MYRRLIFLGTALAVIALGGPGCGSGSAAKPSQPTVPDPNGITVPKPAGGGAPKAG